jgi:DNA-binding transcriptional LysR family regulator
VARHIQQLESSLGLALFDRRPTGLVLNRAGARLAASARGMLEGARAFEQVTAAVRTNGSGIVRIVVPESLAGLLPEVLAPLRERKPDEQVQIDLMVGSESANLLQLGADIALRHSRPEQQDLICRRLAPLPYGLFAAREYVRVCGMPSAEDFDEHLFIDDARGGRLARWAERTRRPIARERFVFRSDAFAGRLAAAVAGWGIAALPVHVGARESGLVRVFENAPDFPVELWLVGRPDVRTVAYLYDTFTSVADLLNGFVAAIAGSQPAGVRLARAVSR